MVTYAGYTLLKVRDKLKEFYLNFDNDTVKDIILTKLLNPEVKLKVCTMINESVNIPFINEKTEQKVFESLWDIVETCIREQLDKELD